jgi:IclR family transcriptional regulator, acetate operon repressor
MSGSPNPTRIRSVARASHILFYVAGEADGPTAKQTAGALDLPLPTTHHLLTTLVAEGLLAKDRKRQYYLGPRVGVLADRFQREVTPPEYLLSPLRALANSTGETAYLSAWRHGEVVVLALLEGRQAVRVGGLHTGLEGVAHARASGKLLLALATPERRAGYLDAHPPEELTPQTIVQRADLDAEFARIRKRRYALEEEEFTLGVGCIALPIALDGATIGAYTVSAPIERFRRNWKQFRRAAQSAADAAVHTALAADS